MRVPRYICEVCKLVVVSFNAWFVWDLCRVQRSRGKDVHWPMQLSMSIAPGPANRASGFRQRSADAALRRNLEKATKGFGPLAAGGLAGCPRRQPLQRPLAGPDLVELAGLAELAE